MRFKMLIAEALRSIRASLSTTFAATVTVLIGMFLLGLAIALGSWVLSWSNKVERGVQVKVFFCTEHTCAEPATTAQVEAVRVFLERDERVDKDKLRFVSKEEALEIMRRRSPELVEDLTYNPLPDAFEVTPVRAEDVEAIAADVRAAGFRSGAKGVEKVDYGEATAKRIIRVGQVISIIFLGVVILLLAASALLIANTIRLSIYARRREIEVMKLVGASNWFVRGPFMLEGLFCGLAGSLLAIALLLLGKEIALPAILGRVDAGSDVQALAFAWTALILLVLGLGLGAAGSGLTLRRFLRI
jgi:cell division transport system permease protein